MTLSDRDQNRIRAARLAGNEDGGGVLRPGTGGFRFKGGAFRELHANSLAGDALRSVRIHYALSRFAGRQGRPTNPPADAFETSHFELDGERVARVAGARWIAYFERNQAGEHVLLSVALA